LKKELVLLLEDGTKYYGYSFGYEGSSCGEVCFNTSMTGYQEILTDPSYAGQIVTMTYPMIGNYGTNQNDSQSTSPAVKGLVVKEYSKLYNNYAAQESLSDFLKRHQIPGIEGVDTRSLTRHIRDRGAMRGIIAEASENLEELLLKVKESPQMSGLDLAKDVSCQKQYAFSESGKFNVVAYDFGAKKKILQHLANNDCQLTIVPANTPAKEVLALKPDGIFLSNGPGDPAAVTYAIENIRVLMQESIPMFGICLGHQLMGLALGAETFKLTFGHRGGNQPVKNIAKGTVEITAQNHGFSIVDESLKNLPVIVTHLNLNDQTIEGIRHQDKPFFSVQYHPEAAPGPNDATYLFKEFVSSMCSNS